MRLPLAALATLAILALAASALADPPAMQEVSTTRKAVGATTGGAGVAVTSYSTGGSSGRAASITPVGGYYIAPVLPAGLTATACVKGGGAVLHKAGGDVCQSKAPIK